MSKDEPVKGHKPERTKRNTGRQEVIPSSPLTPESNGPRAGFGRKSGNARRDLKI